MAGLVPLEDHAERPPGAGPLARWHEDPGAGPVLEFEQLLKVHFAEHGSRADALASLAAARAWAVERNAGNLAVGRDYLAGRGPFPERGAQHLLTARFLTDFYLMVAQWADWATDQVHQWPDDPGQATADPAAMQDVVRRAGWSEPG